MAQNEYTGPLTVPAEFVRDIKVPGLGETILRPSALHYDHTNDEILVGDSGHNRILIFTGAGAFKFEFSLNEKMSSPRDLATDSQGYIYVAGSDPRGSVVRVFDFDGVPLHSLDLPRGDDGRPVVINSLGVGPDDHLFCLDQWAATIHEFSPDSQYLRSFPIVVDGSHVQGEKKDTVLGTLTVTDDELLIPVSTWGTVIRLDSSGRYLGSLGYFGAKAGTLNFPVAVERSPEGIYLILDTTRFCVVCYDSAGQVLGEFGGKGHSPGWFINPTLLSAPSADKVLVGQIFHNKIQVCSIPGFIRLGISQSKTTAVTEHAALSNRALEGAERRPSPNHSTPVDSRGEGFTSQHAEKNSHLEVSK